MQVVIVFFLSPTRRHKATPVLSRARRRRRLLLCQVEAEENALQQWMDWQALDEKTDGHFSPSGTAFYDGVSKSRLLNNWRQLIIAVAWPDCFASRLDTPFPISGLCSPPMSPHPVSPFRSISLNFYLFPAYSHSCALYMISRPLTTFVTVCLRHRLRSRTNIAKNEARGKRNGKSVDEEKVTVEKEKEDEVEEN